MKEEAEKGSKGEKSSNWRSKKDNSHRGTRLVAFLVEWMGLEEMRSGAGVLDIAGGSGLLTFELVRSPFLPPLFSDGRGQPRTKSATTDQNLWFCLSRIDC